MPNHPIYIISAMDKNRGIGKNGKLPWRLKKEIQFFKKITTETESPDKINIVIMGRKTWDSLPEKFRPLPARENIVLTRNKEFIATGAHTVDSLEKAISHADENIEKIFIIGGANLYAQAMKLDSLTGIYITEIDAEFDCDAHLAEFPKDLSNEEILGEVSEKDLDFQYKLYTK